MILKALYDYYHSLPKSAPSGTELKEIEFVIVIGRDGSFRRFESKRIDKKRCASFYVAKAVSRTSSPKSNILWDNGKYVLGLEEAHIKCHSLFVAKVEEIAQRHPDNHSIAALSSFYRQPPEERLAAFCTDPLFNEVKEKLASNFSFQTEGDDRLIAEMAELFPDSDIESDMQEGICLITGEKGPIVRITSATPLPGNSPMAALVAMQKNAGYDSYGKEQAYSSPISPEAEFAYTSALKTLLAKDSKNKIRSGNRTFLFWGSGNKDISNEAESCFGFIINPEPDRKEDPNENLSKTIKLYKSIWSGEIKTTLDDRFHILGLAPNTGRIAIVEWAETSLKEFAGKILRHFDDMEIADNRKPEKQKPYSGIFAMMSAITLSGKTSDALPNLSEALLKSIVSGEQYPYSLYTSALERFKSELFEHTKFNLYEHTASICRAGIMKAYINRSQQHNTNNKKLTIMLDKTNDNQGYLCGRLAATLEKIQDEAKSGDSIRTRYLSAASTTPSAVFPSMMNLSVHHSEKLNNGLRIFYEQLKQEIIEKLSSNGFPAHLDLNDQGRFFVGYYHQLASFYTKKENK